MIQTLSSPAYVEHEGESVKFEAKAVLRVLERDGDLLRVQTVDA